MRKYLLLGVQSFISLVLPLLLTLVAVRVVMTNSFLQIEYTRPGFPVDSYGFTTDDRLTYGKLGIDYLIKELDIDFLANQKLPKGLCYPLAEATPNDCSMFNQLELQHMVDVQQVISFFFRLSLILAGLTIISVVYLYRFDRSRLWISLQHGALITIASIMTIVIIAVIAWNTFFEQFHNLFFQEGTWQFYYSDTLIRLYPEQFWFDASLVVGIIVLISAMGIWLYAYRSLQR